MNKFINKLELIRALRRINFNTNDYIVVCIGTQKAYLDSVGPLVGTSLKKKNQNIIIVGEIGDNCHALSLEEKLKEIKKNYPDKKILAIDACCTSNSNKLGKVEFTKGAIKPGAGIGKILPAIGDYSIKAFVVSKDMQGLLDDTLLDSYYDKDKYIKLVDDAVRVICSAIIRVSK